MSTKHKIFTVLYPILLLLFFVSACKHNPIGIENQPKVDFKSEVVPIIQANCAKSGCHDGGGETRLNYLTETGILRSVTPLQPLNSRLYSAMTDSWGQIMPPPPSLPVPKELRTIVYVWILQGADTTSTLK